MTTTDYFAVLRRSWWIVALAGALGAFMGLGLSATQATSYQAQAQLFVTATELGDRYNPYAGATYVQSRIASYLPVVKSPNVLDPVIAELSLDTDVVELGTLVNATNPPTTTLININASDHTAESSATLANAVAESYAAEIERLEADKVGVDVIRPATPPPTAVAPQTFSNVGLGLLLGLALGVVFSLLRYRRTTDAGRQEAERLA